MTKPRRSVRRGRKRIENLPSLEIQLLDRLLALIILPLILQF
jgi:hypothetical protein